MQRTPQYYDLIEACSQSGCPVCRLLVRDAERFIDSLLYEYVNDVTTQRRFRAARGVCAVHAQMMPTIKGGALGSAILWSAVLDEVQTLEEAGGAGRGFLRGRRSSLADQLEPEHPCAVCIQNQRAERQYGEVICEHVNQAAFAAALRGSEGVCLPHLRLIVRQCGKPEPVDALLAIQREIWERLQADLQLFIRKSDVNYTGEGFGAESDSWKRAIASLAGNAWTFGLRKP